MQTADYWIHHLNLAPHPEGGFYRETYRSKENIQLCGLPSRFPSPRSFSTAIYFLLRSQDKSLFHRIKSDELWHFHAGSALNIYLLEHGNLKIFKLGDNLEAGELLQVVTSKLLVCRKTNVTGRIYIIGLYCCSRFRFQRF